MPVEDDFPVQPSDADGRPLAPLSYAIFLLARAQRAYAAELLRRYGLHPGQELVLLQLYEQDRQTQAALLDAVGLDHSTLSRSLSRMEAAGLVRRSRSAVDRRAVVVSLTAKGKRLREPLHELWRELERTTSGGVPPHELDDLVRSLHGVRRAVAERASDEGVAGVQRQATSARDG